MPDYGMGFEIAIDEPPSSVDPFIETHDWSRPRPKALDGRPMPLWFVDGVRRAEISLMADQDGSRAVGLFGTYAVGSVRCDGRADFADNVVGRAVVLGGGLLPPPIEVRCGRGQLEFEPASEPGSEPDRPIWGLQKLMREAEAALAASLAGHEDALVLCDGPLSFLDLARCPIVGIVKRFARVYLEPEQGALLPQLGPAERTPLFAIGDESDRVRKYAWYLRLSPLRAPWHDHAGLVRCEVLAAIGPHQAMEVADRVANILPSFAGRAGDPRTPQNLAPIAALETWLRHRMGDSLLIRRALLNYLCASEADARISVEVIA
jgi:hypothetical protein